MTEKVSGGEPSRHNIFIYEYTDGVNDSFMLKSAKSGQYLGVMERSGQFILQLFDFSFNRSRELVWIKFPGEKKNTFKFRNQASQRFIGRVSKKPKTLGCVLMVDEEEEGRNLREDVIKHPWSFNRKGKAITIQSSGTLAMEKKGVFSWAPYFEFVSASDNVRERFYLKPAKGNKEREASLYVSMSEDGKISMAKTPTSFVLVPTLKDASFFIKECVTKRLLRVHESGVITTTDILKQADVFYITDVKEVAFSGVRLMAPISDAWKSLDEYLTRLAKAPIAHPVYANLPGVFEREVSRFACMYFIARCNDEKAVHDYCEGLKLDSKERTLLKNAKEAYNMVPVIMQKELPLFRALDQAVTSAKKAVSESEKLFSRFAQKDYPHVSFLEQENDETFVRIALFGDFGSGKSKAQALVQAMFDADDTRPNICIHLGDVYKKGTRREQSENLIAPLVNAITSGGEPARIYILPGNHDYLHKGGDGYYWALGELQRLALTKQQCSFFCLNVGKNYSIIGLDTGLGSLQKESDSLDIRINDEQRDWLKARMEDAIASGRHVIVLSHHPVLACGPISFGTVNHSLWAELAPYMEHIKAWYWGHEHSFRVYEPFKGPDGKILARGRLIGHGSKWKKGKNKVVPFIPVEHPIGREIGACLLEISDGDCVARYVELAGEGEEAHLVENYRETFEDDFHMTTSQVEEPLSEEPPPEPGPSPTKVMSPAASSE